jgi:hypothetical protein
MLAGRQGFQLCAVEMAVLHWIASQAVWRGRRSGVSNFEATTSYNGCAAISANWTNYRPSTLLIGAVSKLRYVQPTAPVG